MTENFKDTKSELVEVCMIDIESLLNVDNIFIYCS